MLDDHEVNMEKMNTWNFQIFDLVDITGGRTGRILSHVSPYQCFLAVLVDGQVTAAPPAAFCLGHLQRLYVLRCIPGQRMA